MRNPLLCLLLTALVPASAYAAKDLTAFAFVQQQCVEVGNITFGAGGRWPSCRISRARWYTTVVRDNLDFYQVQYCLGGQAEKCDARALVLFSNRAYTPTARLVMSRIDSGDATYEDPQVYTTPYGYVMTIAVATPAKSELTFYLWRKPDWQPLDAHTWLKDLSGRLPKGTSIGADVRPDIETLSADVPLFRPGDAACCPSGGNARAQLAIADGRFRLQTVSLAPAATAAKPTTPAP